jgi:hypothetical protein
MAENLLEALRQNEEVSAKVHSLHYKYTAAKLFSAWSVLIKSVPTHHEFIQTVVDIIKIENQTFLGTSNFI